MTTRALVYVHGAGQQPRPPELKHQLDEVLFGQSNASTRVAYYSYVVWPVKAPDTARVDDLLARDPMGRAAVVYAASSPTRSAHEAARQLVGVSGRSAPDAAAALPVSATTSPAAMQLTELLYRRADQVAARSAAPVDELELAARFPGPIFRWAVGIFARDVVDYLYGGYAEKMRKPVRRALSEGDHPSVIVAHSLGSIILYDVLCEPAFAKYEVPLLVTAGCPLGIDNVQDRLREGAGRPNPVPPGVRDWINFADRWDPVAINPDLRDAFDPPPHFATDEPVNNPAPDNHDLTGYLSVGIVRSTILAATGPP